MIFGFKKEPSARLVTKGATELALRQKLSCLGDPTTPDEAIRLSHTTLEPTISNLSLQVLQGDWLILGGKNEFAKALFCDLCFHYIEPDSGLVSPSLSPSDVSFLGRSNTTFGKTLVDHINYLVRDQSKELMEFVLKNSLSDRFKRQLSAKNSLEFASPDPHLEERDYLELAEANLLLQRKKAVVIDTTSDFYQIATEQGFRHSDLFLNSGKILFWILNAEEAYSNRLPIRESKYASVRKTFLRFPAEGLSSYIN